MMAPCDMHTTHAFDLFTLTVDQFFSYNPSIPLAAVALSLMLTAAVAGLCEAGSYAAKLYCVLRSGQGSIFGAYCAQ